MLTLLPYSLAVAQNSPADEAQNDANADKPAAEAPGFTIFGEKELPIGLYITPWLSSPPELSVDRPAQLIQPELEPIDRDVFRRQVEYHRALSEAYAARNAPADPAPAKNTPAP